MQQTVETVEVDERAVVGDVLYDTLADVAGLYFGEELAAFFRALFFDEFAARYNDVLAFRVDLDDLEVVRLTDVLIQILGGLNVDLRSGQERVDTDADDETALDFRLDATGEDCAFLTVGENLFPVLLLLGLVVGDYGIAFAVFEFFQQNFDFLTYLDVVDVDKFAYRHDTFALAADVDYDFVLADFDDFALDYRALFEFGKTAVSQQFFHLVVHCFPWVVPRGNGLIVVDLVGASDRRMRQSKNKCPTIAQISSLRKHIFQIFRYIYAVCRAGMQGGGKIYKMSKCSKKQY